MTSQAFLTEVWISEKWSEENSIECKYLFQCPSALGLLRKINNLFCGRRNIFYLQFSF